MPTDPFELVRRWFQAFNAGDLDALSALYHDDASNDSGTAIARGRDAVRQEMAASLARAAQRHVRMIARVETGAMHAEWRGREQNADGEVATSAGYDEFWIEEGRIRRQRGDDFLHCLSVEAEFRGQFAGVFAARRLPKRRKPNAACQHVGQ